MASQVQINNPQHSEQDSETENVYISIKELEKIIALKYGLNKISELGQLYLQQCEILETSKNNHAYKKTSPINYQSFFGINLKQQYSHRKKLSSTHLVPKTIFQEKVNQEYIYKKIANDKYDILYSLYQHVNELKGT